MRCIYLETEPVKSQRKRTLELFDDQADEDKGDDFLNASKQTKKVGEHSFRTYAKFSEKLNCISRGKKY